MKQLLKVALIGALSFGGAGAVSAQDAPPTQERPAEQPAEGQDALPTPPEGWWREVQPGEYAVYAMNQMGMDMKLKFTIDSREEAKITFSTTMEVPGMPQAMPPQTTTIDANDPEALENKKLPPGATVKKLGDETVNAAGRDWTCSVYEIEGEQRGQKMKMKLWHSAELRPVFNGGAVKMEVEAPGPAGPMLVTILLSEVGAAPASGGGAAPEKPAGE